MRWRELLLRCGMPACIAAGACTPPHLVRGRTDSGETADAGKLPRDAGADVDTSTSDAQSPDTCRALCDRVTRCGGCGTEDCANECVDQCKADLAGSSAQACHEPMDRWLACVQTNSCSNLSALGYEFGSGSLMTEDCAAEAEAVHCSALTARLCAPLDCGRGECELLDGRPTCTCPSGTLAVQELLPLRCEDVDECSINPCQNNATCLNTWRSYECLCPTGHGLTPERACAPAASCLGSASPATFTVKKTGNGFARIHVSAAGCTYSCSEGCSLDLPREREITITVEPGATSRIRAAEGCKIAEGGCTLQLLADSSVTFDLALMGHLVFTTSKAFTGDLGGQEKANGLCDAQAGEAGLEGSNWIAVLADRAGAPLKGVTGPWVRLDGRVARESNETNGWLSYPTDLDENGSPLPPSTSVWVGSSAANCSDWGTASKEVLGATRLASGQHTTDDASTSCDQRRALTCVHRGYGDVVGPIDPTPGRYVFVSRGTFVPSAATTLEGLFAADRICFREACSLGITSKSLTQRQCGAGEGPNRWKALLSTTRESALSRIHARPGLVWVRPDGLPWAESLESLSAGHTLTGLIEPGRTEPFPLRAFSGYRSAPSALAQSVNDSCYDWRGLTNVGLRAAGLEAGSSGFLEREASCIKGARLICVEDPDETDYN